MILLDYKVYVMDRREKIMYTVRAAAVLAFLGYLFFNNILVSLLCCLGSFYYPRWKSRELLNRRKIELNLQFKDALYSLAAYLAVGKSLETALRETRQDLRSLYPDDGAIIVSEIEFLCRRMELNYPLENDLRDFAERSGLEDIKNFAEVISICGRSGGNMVQVVQSTARVIGTKLDILQEIDLTLTRQRFEQRLLNLMPLVFLGLIRFAGAGYMNSLYNSAFGYAAMSAALMIIILANYISGKILEIRV